jgi:hypothetical protein
LRERLTVQHPLTQGSRLNQTEIEIGLFPGNASAKKNLISAR